MASENNDIGDIVRKCKILLLDIEGTTTSISFVKDKLFPYAEANVKEFLGSQWENEDVKKVVGALRKLAVEDEEKKVEGVVTIPGEDAGKDEQIEGLVKSVQWQMSADRKVGPLKQLQGLIWKKGYEKGDIKGHVYDDVSPALKQWRSTEGQKVYIYSSGSVQAQKLLFGQSVVGDLMPLIEGYFDTAVGAKQESTSYVAIAEKIGCKPDDILFLSDIVKEAEAARAAGLNAALVSREGNAPLPDEATATFPVLHSFDQLTISNKRKPDPQEQELPAKVPKTDKEADVKTASEAETGTAPAPETVASKETVSVNENPAAKEPEKMEVEEEDTPVVSTTTAQVDKEAEKAEKTHVRVETTIEEITNSSDAADAAVCDIEPIVEESVEKTEKNETEQMDTDTSEIVEKAETAIEPKEPLKENNEQNASIAEETPPNVITVQDITNDQKSITEAAEIIDGAVPVIEEPLTEMEDLKNVGEVLEKECDEILSKVQNVTNLDNIPVKPLLNSIPEESIDAENGENTNDIVESILDSEMELGEKPIEDIDVNSVQEITSTKVECIEEKSENNDAKVEESTVKKDEKPEDKANENIVEGNKADSVVENATVEKMEENSSTEVTEEFKKNEVQKVEIEVANEVTNGDVKESKPESGEDKMDTGDTKLESNAEPEKKEITVEITNNKSDLKQSTIPEDNKMDSEETIAEVVENKAETNGNIESVDDKVETNQSVAVTLENNEDKKDSIVKPVENNVAQDTLKSIESKTDIIVESADSEMQSEDKTVVDNQKESEQSTTELVKNTTEAKESNTEQKDNKLESEKNTPETVDNKMESEDIIPKPDKNEIKSNAIDTKVEDSKMESEESSPQESKKEESAVVPETPVSETKSDSTEATKPPPAEVIESKEIASAEVEMESVEKKVNGETNVEINVNGIASKDDELNARLSVENGENGKEINGENGNGDSPVEEKGQGDNKVETEIPDIKVKTVTVEEPRSDPIEQPTEA